jgi:hypothetical protein
VWFWQQAIKDRYYALRVPLSGWLWLMDYEIEIALTCRMSSKSRAAIFFNSEIFAEKRLIVPVPKEGTCLKLKGHVMLLSHC